METDRILEKLGISELNDMQKEATQAVLRTNNDVVILSPTGSGKTLAYLLPLVQLIDASVPTVQAVVIVPGRELALQSATVLKDMGCGLRACACYGGRAAMDEHRVLRQVQPHIVFATPGRLLDHIEKENILTTGIRYLVIDEFDKCLEMGFLNEMNAIINRLSNVQRRILISATDAESIPHFVNMGRTTRMDYLIEEEQVSDRVNVYQVISPVKDKLETLRNLLCELGEESSIVFLNYRESVERVADYLQEQGFTLSYFHGGLEQRQREDALYKFSNASANVLVSTDLASRGLDIPSINNIIHYHLPESEQGYIHRVGRTARWDKLGKTFFILNQEESIPDYIDAEPTLHTIPIDLPAPPKPKMVTFGLKGTEIGRISVEDRFTYVAIDRAQLRSVLRNVQGEKIKGVKTIIEEVR